MAKTTRGKQPKGVISSPKHERFAQGLAQGKSANEAYEYAGYAPHRGNAARLSANEHVLRRVAELQERGAIRAEVTVQSICTELDELARAARHAGSYGPAVSAVMGKAKVCGLIVDKVSATVRSIENLTNDELDAIIAGNDAEARTGGAHTAH